MCEQCRPKGGSKLLRNLTEEQLDNLTEEQVQELIEEIKNLPSTAMHWRERGNYYGYPSCCVNAFVRRPYDAQFTDDEVNYSKGGFLPCKKHLKMIKQGKVQIEDLIQDRQCKTGFPDDDYLANNLNL
jgi:hypothetical protein